MTNLLKMQGISKAFFGVPVLKNIDFDLDRGEVHVLLGENGAGKSTLMKILSGAYETDAGSVVLDSETLDLNNYHPVTAEALGIVTIYQHFHLIPHLSVAENLAMPLFTSERGLIRWREVDAHARAVLERIHYDIDPKAKVKDLPVSQKQMLEIAIALSKNAKVIVMDEPTAALSRNETDILFDAIAEIKARGIGIIYISHKLEEVKQVGDRITVLRDGEKITTVSAEDADLDEIVGLMIGKELTRSHEGRDVSYDGDLLNVTDIQSVFLLSPANFSVRKREILGITGLVGAGKTELARALFGADKLVGGSLVLNGDTVVIDSPETAVGSGIGYLPEDRDADGLCLNLSVKQNVSMVLLTKLRGILFNRNSETDIATRVVRSMDIKTSGLSQEVKYLSGGNKQKVVLGKWLSADCNLLILDEPTIGIDVGARGEIYSLIREFVDEAEDRAVIFISSDMTEVIDVTDRILVMADGNLVAELDPKQTSKQEIMHNSVQAQRVVE
ncbi:MAG: sugar ABC transporter ATP-binding protein [Chloroflexota bacterium]|nr:sugar ABC transporter ATP-binding protein [Chloroflexota bacterium]